MGAGWSEEMGLPAKGVLTGDGRINEMAFPIDATGDACVGDVVLFAEAVFGGGRSAPTFLGERRIAAEIVKDSYGVAKQQHTFTLLVIASDGYEPIDAGKKILRKGRNLYRRGTRRAPWAREGDRSQSLRNKHERGRNARAARQERLARKAEAEQY